MTTKFKNKIYNKSKPQAQDDLMEAMEYVSQAIGSIPKAITKSRLEGHRTTPVETILIDIIQQQYVAITSLEDLYWGLKSEVMEYSLLAQQQVNLEADFIDDVNNCEESVIILDAELKHLKSKLTTGGLL